MALLRFFTLVQTYNAIVVFSFVTGGLTTFWLCLEMTGSSAGSPVGGAIFEEGHALTAAVVARAYPGYFSRRGEIVSPAVIAALGNTQ